MMFTIYALKDPAGAIRYVGKTVQSLPRRLSCHLYKARSGRSSTPCALWLKELQDQGLVPTIEMLESCLGENWQERERFWISLYDRLLNQTAGGNGSHKRSPFPETYKHLLGVYSDYRISLLVGISREMVCYHRHLLGIQASKDSTLISLNHACLGKKANNRFKFDESLLGKISDRELSRQVGCSKTTIHNRRVELEIPPFQKDFS